MSTTCHVCHVCGQHRDPTFPQWQGFNAPMPHPKSTLPAPPLVQQPSYSHYRSEAPTRPRLDTAMRETHLDFRGRQGSHDNTAKAMAPASAPPTMSPYAFSRVTPSPPLVTLQPTPPQEESVSRTSTSTNDSRSGSHATIPEKVEPIVAALPGTMTSRSQRDRSRGRSSGRSASATRPKTQRKSTVARRCQSIIREMFATHPVDESQLEHIESTHWAEEY